MYMRVMLEAGEGLCEIKGEGDGLHIALDRYQALHPEVELRANLRSIFHRCHLFEVAFVWELAEETIHLPLARATPSTSPSIGTRLG